MHSYDEKMNQTISEVSSLLAKIDNEEELQESECMQLVTDLKELREEADIEAEGEQSNMSLNIEELLSEFNSSADGSKIILQNMLSAISEGRVPQTEEMKELDDSIDELRQKYESIYSMALTQVAEEEMPEKGLSAGEYVEAVKNSVSLLYKKQIEEIKKVLEDFISVRSLVSNYAAALRSYQDEARALLNGVSNGENTDVESLNQKIVGPKVFLQTMECEDIDSDEGQELLDKVSAYYPRRVENGLAANKYFIEKTNEENVTSDNSENESIPEEENPISEDHPEDSNTQKDDVRKSADESKINDEESSQDKPEEIENREEEKPVSDFVQNIIKSDFLIKATDNAGLFSSEISPNEDKKISASVFQNDVRKGNEKAIKEVLKAITGKNCISELYMSLMKGMPESVAKQAFEYLLRKGYVRKYKVDVWDGIYCSSPKLMKALTYKDAAKMLGMRRRTIESWGEIVEDKNTCALCRIIQEKLYCESLRRFMAQGKTSFTETQSTMTEAFYSCVYPSDNSDTCDIIIGAFWTDTEECDDYSEGLEKALEANDSVIGCVFIAALDLDKAVALADILIKTHEKLSSADIYLYSFNDDSYYAYPSREKVEKSAIRGTQNEDNNDEDKESNSDQEGKVEEEDVPVIAHETPTETANTSKTTPVDKKPEEKKPEPEKHDEKPDTTESNSNVEKILQLVNEKRFYAATAYAKAISVQKPEYTMFYNQLAHALNDPMGHCNYATNNVFNLIEQRGEFEDALVISTAIRTFFSNQVRYDYNIKSLYSGIKEYRLLNDHSALSKVVYSLMEFKDNHQKGLDAYADYRSKNQNELDLEMRKLQVEARTFYENFVIGKKKEKASQKRFLETKKLIFSADSEFGIYIKAIVDGEVEMQPLAMEFLQKNFYKEDSMIEEDTIDADKLWDYIMIFWEQAGDHMMYRRHSDLMSHLRSNITSTTTKAVQLIVRWCDMVNRISNRSEDEGSTAYKKLRKGLLENLSESLADLESDVQDEAVSSRESAGIKILLYTLQEIKDCVDGTFAEESRHYFYVPFLQTDDIMLDENYLPDLDMHSSAIPSLFPVSRIMDHVQKAKNGLPGFDSRLTEILEDKGDDYGQARLILDYLKTQRSDEDFSVLANTIESGEAYARETADLRKDDFIGELELAQSYGQIDNSVEDKKEKILQIINAWYEWAIESSNYGFFNRVMDGYLTEIKEEAKAREKVLLEQLESYKSTSIPGLSAEAKEKRVARIQRMIREQNYTVAEDLLARTDSADNEHEELLEDDFLKEFLDNYDDYYQPVATHKSSFASLVSSRTRNKEERGAKKLADNWLPGGSLLGAERLTNLLVCLGFKVDSVKAQAPIGKFEHFFVQTAKAQGGQRDNYTHPIAAFGSGAALDGFRVICVNGGYDADGLIEIMKQIGNARHTLILFDYALSKSERRRLARKSKNALGDKLFGVLDRTIMMFLVRNFDETKMNRMLISLITPFGYYQPYVWESANVMPPEIFMGRKIELERIKSPTGVNIVYGGRQLGKSALLKKAKEDIDWDENGNRAILVDIKGLDYKKAAKKIGHELYDAFVLEQDIDTEDWDDLARAVRRRLKSDTKRIPYLLLLLDEADVFIESCAAVNYQPFDALKDIQSVGAGRFKFVIAGLRNIVRLKREALGNNSVLTHLEPMTVKPFNTSEARELLEVPLHYLGLRFPKEKESLITLILATTNYFPGLIQMYCAKLINAMRSKDYAKYDEVSTPIYEVSEEHIKKVLADPEFTQQIREKFFITLKLDEDNYYYLIALLMAYLYHNNGYNEGYSAADIKNAGAELEISKITNLELDKLESFMEELKELNVLRSTDDSHYLFTRFTFFQMMGTRAEVDDKLEECMEE